LVSVFSKYRHQGFPHGVNESNSDHQEIREPSAVWRFISLKKAGTRYAWDEHLLVGETNDADSTSAFEALIA
jgi:hypothetical protein